MHWENKYIQILHIKHHKEIIAHHALPTQPLASPPKIKKNNKKRVLSTGIFTLAALR